MTHQNTPASVSPLAAISDSPDVARFVSRRLTRLMQRRHASLFPRTPRTSSDTDAQYAKLLLLSCAIRIVQRRRPSLRQELRARLVLRNGRFEPRLPDEFYTDTPTGRTVERVSLLLLRLILRRQESFEQAIAKRLRALLQKHDAPLFARWSKLMDEEGSTLRAGELLIVAASASVFRRWPDADFSSTKQQRDMQDTAAGRAAARNERLLSRLLYRGVARSGEFTPLA